MSTRPPRLGGSGIAAQHELGSGHREDQARRQAAGHDLSLAVMQAKALRSAVDSGLEVPPEVIQNAIKCVREHYVPANGKGRNDAREPMPVRIRLDDGKHLGIRRQRAYTREIAAQRRKAHLGIDRTGHRGGCRERHLGLWQRGRRAHGRR